MYLERVLLPMIKPSDFVIMDILGSHKSKAVRDAIRSTVAHRIFLPGFSPGLIPIEQMFAKPKTSPRKARAGTLDVIAERHGVRLGTFSSPSALTNELTGIAVEHGSICGQVILLRDSRTANVKRYV